MSKVTQGNSVSVLIPDGRRIKVTTDGEAVFEHGEIKRRLTSEDQPYYFAGGDALSSVIRAISGVVTYTIFYTDVVPFTGNRTLNADDNGKVLRCDDASNVTITVPRNLPECFTCGFLTWGAGTVTVSAGSGATKRSTTSALSTQFSGGSVLVAKNADDVSAEFILSGGFA
ncbi:hypothetical protein XH99_31860 [Bradyrhizobium nanningense]|uniref:Uncharacterized protein n=1 Tax=Bradyrhizobium nanningense TaxID=1325118 RepID=A0A4Q0RWR0_9BRAD|nr:hypothetical protein [Bradyrhizobium nanningense]RXH23310.1 hypothetical protein XH99_31860 [Bradyrhizobium nanningense]RXH27589.1 hypothetical protein XH84_29775 [Bradyrhizobium nanningense]